MTDLRCFVPHSESDNYLGMTGRSEEFTAYTFTVTKRIIYSFHEIPFRTILYLMMNCRFQLRRKDSRFVNFVCVIMIWFFDNFKVHC